MADSKTLTLALAKKLVEQGCAKAAESGAPMAVVVVDKSGNVITGDRMDGLTHLTFDIATKKAAASAAFGAPTMALNDMANQDPAIARAFGASDSVSIVPGGLPVMIDGACVGGIGVSGGHYSQDHEIAEAAVAGL